MNKPTVFFSHSTKNKASLNRLKEYLETKTGGVINIFLSSDGESIPFGRNWVHKVQDGLEKTSLMFVFLSPDSFRSSWVHFEAGFVYSKGIKVVPVGILGINLNDINPPLSLLQGFNIEKDDAIGNIITIINDTYDCKFDTNIEKGTYQRVFSHGEGDFQESFIKHIDFRVVAKPDTDIVAVLHEFASQKNIQLTRSEFLFLGFGLTVRRSGPDCQAFVVMDGLTKNIYLPIIKDAISLNDFQVESMSIYFNEKYALSSEDFLRQSALIRDTDINISSIEIMEYLGVKFKLASESTSSPSDRIRMDIMNSSTGLIDEAWIEKICSVLYEKSVIIKISV